MKKNNVMRVFSLLLALTLISVCAISGTFAKYVTKAEGKDNARVAKWGVLLNVEGSAFASKYATSDDTYAQAGGEYSVEAFNGTDKVVAPGTNSEEVGQTLTASVTGTPEVAARYAIEVKNVKDIVLPAGTYTDYTAAPYEGTFTLDKAYAPVKWNLTISKGNTTVDVATLLYRNLPENLITVAEGYGLTRTGCSVFDAVEILKKVAGNDGYKTIVGNALGQVVTGGRNFQLDIANDGTLTLSYDFDPNKVMDFTFELSWEWAFEGNDQADTFLGNVAAGVVEFPDGVVPAGISTTIAADIVATATQID